jgi:diguanylate cyclase (GGDEF)-like protein
MAEVSPEVAMRIGRHESFLIVGLAIAFTVAFSGQVSTLLQEARDFEGQHHLGLLPGFTIAALTLVAFLLGKRRELQQRAASVAAEAAEARNRARELERLVTFWQALTQSFDHDTTRDVLERHLPDITGSGEVWVVAGGEGSWTSVLGPTVVRTDHGEAPVIDLARSVVSRQGAAARPDGIDVHGQACFPMVAAGMSLGVLGLPVASQALAPARRLVIGAAVGLVGVSLNSVRLLQEIRESSLRDSLTGCANRAHAMEVLATELARARRSRHPVSLIMFDVDRFKSINDLHGHLCGDTVLAEVGARLRASLRSSDLKCRYGGEEFLVLLPETPLEGARRAAETLRDELSRIAIPWNGETVRLTGSFGVACARPDEENPSTLIGRADEALYRAKREGRDSVRIAIDAAAADGPASIGDEPGR